MVIDPIQLFQGGFLRLSMPGTLGRKSSPISRTRVCCSAHCDMGHSEQIHLTTNPKSPGILVGYSHCLLSLTPCLLSASGIVLFFLTIKLICGNDPHLEPFLSSGSIFLMAHWHLHGHAHMQFQIKRWTLKSPSCFATNHPSSQRFSITCALRREPGVLPDRHSSQDLSNPIKSVYTQGLGRWQSW